MEYEDTARQYQLPEDLNKVFELEDCKSLAEIRKKISEHIESYVQYLEGLLQPETSMANLIEVNLFDEEEKKKVFSVYKQLMFLHRGSLELGLENHNGKDAEFINAAYSEWLKIREELKRIIRKIKESWKQESEIEYDPGYFG